TGPTDYVSNGERTLTVSNGDPLLGTVSGTGCMSSALTGCFVAVAPPLEGAAYALAAFGVAGEDAARDAKGTGTFHANLYDGVHLGRGDEGKELARAAGLMLGISATSIYEAIAAAEQGATYIGAGPIWETPTKPDAGSAIGLDGLAAICEAVKVPVVAIGGV